MSSVSFSRYSTFLACAERYRLEYVAKVEEETPCVWLPVGVAMHAACDALDLEGSSLSMAVENFRVELDHGLTEQETESGIDRGEFRVTGVTKEVPAGRDEAWWNDNVSAMLQSYIDWKEESGYKLATIAGKPGVEVPVELDLGQDVILRGYIDRVFERPDGDLEIVDLKTGQTQPGLYQLATYAYGMRVQTGQHANWGSYFMLAKHKKSAPKWLPQYDNGTKVQQTYLRLAGAIDAGYFPPNVGGDCFRCPVAKHCQFA